MSTVELTRETDGPGLARGAGRARPRRRARRGRAPRRAGRGLRRGELAHAIEDWIAGRDLPLVPLRIDDCTFAVGPPADRSLD